MMLLYAFAFVCSAIALASPACKLSPSDHDWPSVEEWGELNRTIGNTLLKAASSCYQGNPLDSPLSCRTVEGNWTSATFHAGLPESIASPLYANNSCLPPGADGYNATGGCYLAWRSSYLHVMSYGAKFNKSLAPQNMLKDAAEQLEEGIESLWREWAPETAAYMNEGNPLNSNFKKDFYGSYYDRLMQVKNKYDPINSLWVLSGVGSDAWDYNLNTGKLCKQ
ncbi:isoamyl alcohol [Fusarium langsethiae]|uniref:Isoamyl alcohol n=1 Tax=Fusarium langsethiae TaxID=179993 RepID=A0A0M9ENI0_FUSLA|nr:isoamyl alcohol [Fusarium langsethiae]